MSNSKSASADEFEVVVVGAGISGLVATLRLQQIGKKVLLIEAQDWLGGRCAGPPDEWGIEPGAEFLHGESAATWALLSEFNLIAERHPEPNLVTRKYWNNLDLGSEYSAMGKLVDSLCELTEKFTEDISTYSTISEFFENKSHIRSLLQGENLSVSESEIDHAIRFAEERIERFEGSPISNLSALQFAIQMELATNGTHNYRISGGYQRLVSAISAMLESSSDVVIRCGEAVDLIDASSPNRVSIQTKKGNTYKSRKVLVTVPLPILKAGTKNRSEELSELRQSERLRIVPDLGLEFEQAIESLEIGHALKVVVAVRNLDDCNFGLLHTLEEMPTWIRIPNPDPNITVLLGYFGGKTAQKLDCKNDEELRILAKSVLKRVLNIEDVQFCDPIKIYRWSKAPYIHCAYSYPGENGIAAARVLSRPMGNLVFAGEALSQNGHIGTVHGAIETAERAVVLLANSP